MSRKYIYNKCDSLIQHPIICRCISDITLLIIKHNTENIKNIETIVTQLLVNGQCFFDKDNELINYDSVQIDNEKSYKFSHEGRVFTLLNVKRIFANHLKISSYDMAIRYSNILNAIDSYISNIIKSGGRPSGVFSLSNLSSQTNKDEIRQTIHNFLSNIGTNNSSMIIDGNYQWQNLGTTPQELQILELKKEISKAICMCFNIPPTILGIDEKVYTNNYNTARKRFTEDFIIPLYTKICLEYMVNN